MGYLWGDEYQIATGTSTSPVFSDAAKDNPWKLIPIKAVLNDVKVSTVFKNEIMLGLGARTERLFQSASDTTLFAQGLLNHSIVSSAIGYKETKAYLEALHGESVSVEYHYMAPLNMAHVAMQYLAQTQGYSPRTNIATVQSAFQGVPVYVEHVELRLRHAEGADMPDVDERPEWEAPPSVLSIPWDNPLYDYWQNPPANWTYTTTEDSWVQYHYAWMGVLPRAGTPTALAWAELEGGIDPLAVPPNMDDPLVAASVLANGYNWELAYGRTTAVKEDFIRRYTIQKYFNTFGYEQGKDYFQTKYYRALNGTLIPEYFTHAVDAGTISSIENTIDLDTAEPEFFPIIFLRKNFETIADLDNKDTLEYTQSAALCKTLGLDYQSFADGVFEEAEIADISQAFFTFGVPINSDLEAGRRYLYEFFYWLNLDNGDRASMNVYNDGDWYRDDLQEKKAIHFTDSAGHIRLEYIGTVTRLVEGNLGEGVASPVGTCSSAFITQTQHYRVTRRTSYNSNEAQYQTITLSRDIKVWRFRKQVSSNRFREILVAEPQLSYRLLDSRGGSEQWAYVTDDENLLIPLNHTLVVEHFTSIERTQIYAESMHLQVNSYTKEKLSWYETSRFSFFLTASAMVLVAISAGSASGPIVALYTSILGTVGSAVVAVILTTLIVIGVQYGLAKVFSLIIEEIGSKWGHIGSALMLVVATYMATQGMPEAQYWVMSANGFTDAASAQTESELIEFEQELINLRKEYEDFMETKEEYDDEMDARKTLMAAIGLTSVHNPYESAEEFYARTASGVESAHVTVNGPEAFLRASLMLPTTISTGEL